jgi:hypothetical protein
MRIKKTTSKLKTKKDIKISLATYYAKLRLTKKFGPQSNSCIPQLLFYCKYKYM